MGFERDDDDVHSHADSVSHFVDTWAAEHEADDSQEGTRKVPLFFITLERGFE